MTTKFKLIFSLDSIQDNCYDIREIKCIANYQMTIKKPRISGYISAEHRAKLDRLVEQEQCTQGALIENLLDMYDEYQQLKDDSSKIQYGELSFNNIGLEVVHNQDGSIKENQVEIVDRAIKNSGHSLNQIVKDGTLQRARYLNSIAESQAQLNTLSEDELKEKTFKGVANYRIEQAIDTIKNHNDLQSEKANKVCITKGMVFKLTGSNRQTINKFFDTYQTTIDDHNQKHQLTDKDNRKGKNFSFEELLRVA